jgi:FdhD protein
VQPVTAVVIRRIRAHSQEETGDVVAREYPVTLVCRGHSYGSVTEAGAQGPGGGPGAAGEGPGGGPGAAGEGPGGSGAVGPEWELATLMCTPEHLDELALGFLYTGGLVSSREEVLAVEVEAGPDAGRVFLTLAPRAQARLAAWWAGRREDWQATRPLGTGCGYAAPVGEGELPTVGDNLRVTVAEIMDALSELVRAPVHRETGATHAAALARRGGIICLREDVGRHNAVDKIAGWWLARAGAGDGRTGDMGLLVLTTGRLSSDLVLKASRLGAEVLVSRAAPTSLGIRLAHLTGITLIGFARAGHLNVYTFPDRVVSGSD